MSTYADNDLYYNLQRYERLKADINYLEREAKKVREKLDAKMADLPPEFVVVSEADPLLQYQVNYPTVTTTKLTASALMNAGVHFEMIQKGYESSESRRLNFKRIYPEDPEISNFLGTTGEA